MSISNTLNSYLSNQHIDYDLLSHPVTFSCRDTAKAAHINEDHIAKAVIVKDRQGYAMVVIPGSDWIKVHALQNELNRDFQLAEESELHNLFTDCAKGAIPPLGQAYGLDTFLDESLNSLANIYFEAGDHEHLIHIRGDQFQKLFKGVRHGHFSH
ncbi:MAG: YbaK/EbsC family protein [Gammaproteobacteria bacterium]|nr:YbaK/EbsC family protein [Gammaproteobacteria bacterium]